MTALIQIIEDSTLTVLDERIKTPIEAYPIGSIVSIFSPTGASVKTYRVIEVKANSGQVFVETHESYNEQARFLRPQRVLKFFNRGRAA